MAKRNDELNFFAHCRIPKRKKRKQENSYYTALKCTVRSWRSFFQFNLIHRINIFVNIETISSEEHLIFVFDLFSQYQLCAIMMCCFSWAIPSPFQAYFMLIPVITDLMPWNHQKQQNTMWFAIILKKNVKSFVYYAGRGRWMDGSSKKKMLFAK